MKLIILILSLLITSPALASNCSEDKAIWWLWRTIFHEGRSESYIGRVAIVQTIYNRIAMKRGIAAYRNTICSVVSQHKQYSYTLLSEKILKYRENKEKHTREAIKEIANYIYFNAEKEFDKTGLTVIHTHYMTTKLWRDTSTKYERKQGCKHKIIGSHVFYGLCGRVSVKDMIMRRKLMRGK